MKSIYLENNYLRYFVGLIILLISNTCFGHGGRTDSHGCHHSRATGGYHCHGIPSPHYSNSINTVAPLPISTIPSPANTNACDQCQPRIIEKPVEKIVEKTSYILPQDVVKPDDKGRCEKNTYSLRLDNGEKGCQFISPKNIPENAIWVSEESSWKCKSNYFPIGALSDIIEKSYILQCVPIENIKNAQVNSSSPFGWSCQSGYRRDFEQGGCEKIEITQGMELNSKGDGLQCKFGYGIPRNWKGQEAYFSDSEMFCEKLEINYNQKLSATGRDVSCKVNTFPFFAFFCMSILEYISFIVAVIFILQILISLVVFKKNKEVIKKILVIWIVIIVILGHVLNLT